MRSAKRYRRWWAIPSAVSLWANVTLAPDSWRDWVLTNTAIERWSDVVLIALLVTWFMAVFCAAAHLIIKAADQNSVLPLTATVIGAGALISLRFDIWSDWASGVLGEIGGAALIAGAVLIGLVHGPVELAANRFARSNRSDNT